MGLHKVFVRLRADVSAERHSRPFESGKQVEPQLANYSSANDILQVLEGRDPSTYSDRTALVRALLSLHHARAGSLWGSVLCVGFAPMLHALRRRLSCELLECWDLDQLVLEGFFVAIAEYGRSSSSTHLASRIRYRTHAHVFARLIASRKWNEGAMRLQQACGSSVGIFESRIPRQFDSSDRTELAESLRDMLGGTVPERKLELVIATRLAGVTITEYVRTMGVPQDSPPRAFASMVQCTKREHSRTLRQLRPIVEAQLKRNAESTCGVAYTLE
jgi:hypothetical protein